MNNNNLKMWGVAALALIVIVGGFFLVFQNKAAPKSQVNQQTSNGPESVQDVTDTTGAPAAAISYTNALIKYANRRIQLDTNCQAVPTSVTYKDNTGIMIDNRSAQTRVVKVGTTFTMRPWSFKIVVLPDVYLTQKTLLVDCANRQNVATILIQE